MGSELEAAESGRPTAAVFADLRRVRYHLAWALDAAGRATWSKAERELLYQGVALARAQLNSLEQLSQKVPGAGVTTG